MIPPRTTSRRALTLFEIIISIALISMLLSAMLVFFWQFMEVREQTALAADRTQIARLVMERIAAELRGCIGSDEIGFPTQHGGKRLIGDRRSITFLTVTVPDKHQYQSYDEFDDPPPAQHDLRQVGYSLWIDPEETTEEGDPIVGGLIRTELKTLNQFIVEEDDPEQIRNDLWSHELGYIEFRYFDGVEWDTKWDITEGISLPQLVQITVGFDSITNYELDDEDLDEYPLDEFPLGDDLPHPDRYSTIVKIPAADKFFSSRIQRVGQQFSQQLGVEGLQP